MLNALKKVCEANLLDLKKVTRLIGGDINHSFRLQCEEGSFFIKMNDANLYPEMLVTEAKGLQLLAGANCIQTPKIINTGIINDFQYLLLEYIDAGQKPSNTFWEVFGRNIAALHQTTNDHFGLHYNNYIGTLPQINEPCIHFENFYSNQRILPIAEQLAQLNELNADAMKSIGKFCQKLPELIPNEAPALLHGDLWGGNYLVTSFGTPCFIDPAPYFGCREIDIAMTMLFGGFHSVMYDSYQHYYPMLSGWQQRIPIFHVYPLLVHARMMGGGYAWEAMQIIKRYI